MASVAQATKTRTLPIATDWSLEKLVCWTLVFSLVFVMGADFRGDTGEDFKVHWQIYLRLLVAFASGLVGSLILFPRSFRDFLTWPGLLLTLYIGWYFVTLATSVSKSYSIAAWASLLGVGIFIPGALRILGGYRFLAAVAAGLAVYLVGSWVAYLAFPEIGVFAEQISKTEVYERMGGLGHPNELGFYSAYTVLVFTGLGISKRVGWPVAGIGIVLGFVTLAACFSRTAMAVCCIGLLFTLQDYVRLKSNVVGMLLATLVLLFGAFIAVGSGKLDWMIERTLTGVSKSGSTDELTTATGRTEIWAYGIKQISTRPTRGFGYCTARFVMIDHSYHCHNIVLNALMFGGIISGMVVLGMIGYLLYTVFLDRLPIIDGLAVMMLAGGMVEGLLGAASPSASSVIWIMLLFWRQICHEVDQDLNASPVFPA